MKCTKFFLQDKCKMCFPTRSMTNRKPSLFQLAWDIGAMTPQCKRRAGGSCLVPPPRSTPRGRLARATVALPWAWGPVGWRSIGWRSIGVLFRKNINRLGKKVGRGALCVRRHVAKRAPLFDRHKSRNLFLALAVGVVPRLIGRVHARSSSLRHQSFHRNFRS